MYISPANQKAAAGFLNSPLWTDWKRALIARCPAGPDVKDDVHVSAQKGHQVAAYMKAVEEFEKLPFEFEETGGSPFERPAITVQED